MHGPDENTASKMTTGSSWVEES